ncbi:30S ribosomal protein S5 [Candidatus Acetothermia bacterium]|nr:30S ribosomal protein S5 [Candidatus Acetothermia bacterium]MCI2427594.1 30S ribosomal protein S5 [Candidatus Acetothermia bacterium]
MKEKDEYISEILNISRVSTVTKGGRTLKFRVLLALGDQKGKVGIGFGKTIDIPRAIEQATRNAKKQMIDVKIVNGTIPHQVEGKFKAATVMLKPAYPGTGVIAGMTVGMICRLAGIKDILTKSLGTNNPVNLAQATIEGLEKLRSAAEIGNLRDKELTSTAKPEAKIIDGEEDGT